MTTPLPGFRIFSRADWLCGLIAGVIAFAVYFWTTAPNVTLLDSGEFIVAAQHFGVPHPTGYPLWTFLAWLFQLLPLGNAAWEINLFSGVCGALATALAAMLIRNSALWMSDARMHQLDFVASIVSIPVSLTFAFSFSMWSQAVIAEVYTLHALLIGFYFLSLYIWIRTPESETIVLWVFFTLTLAFSNHHLSLVLAPLPFLVAMLIRKDLLPDLLMASLLCALIAYLGFAVIADNPLVLKAAIRLAWLIVPVFIGFVIIRKMRVHFRLLIFLPFAIALGMLPYAYLPIASATNPPMNWGYTRTTEGFFASFNRSQYQGSLSDQSLRALTSIVGMGTSGPSPKSTSPSGNADAKKSGANNALQWTQFFWEQLLISFSPISIILFFGVALFALRQKLHQRIWYYVLLIGFCLAAFLQPVIDRARTDNAGWWLQMPYHTFTNLLFALICGIGGVLLIGVLSDRRKKWRPLAFFTIWLMPAWAIFFNASGASQRDRWFGWQFGHDMLNSLPPNAVVFGGTDPGRFIPTYMIFGESAQSADVKPDPDFDRRDLYIITQNATADPLYLAYLRDHYGSRRPQVENTFERWLGRDSMYPSQPLQFPSRQQVTEILTEVAKTSNLSTEGIRHRHDLTTLTHGEIARWLFEKNKANHRFFVEESYPLKWSYDHAIPSGLLYEIAPEPLEKIPPDAVKADMEFWKSYVDKLVSNPDYFKDYDAQRSFTKPRLASARIYFHRHMYAEAKQAAQEAIRLWPGNLEAIHLLSEIYRKEGNTSQPLILAETALLDDPRNTEAAKMYLLARDRHATEPEILKAIASYRTTPTSFDAFKNTITLLSSVGDRERIESLKEEAIPHLGKNDDYLALMTDMMMQFDELEEASALARTRAENATSSDLWLDLAVIESQRNQLENAKAALDKALEIDRRRAIERFTRDPYLEQLRTFSQAEETQ